MLEERQILFSGPKLVMYGMTHGMDATVRWGNVCVLCGGRRDAMHGVSTPYTTVGPSNNQFHSSSDI